MLYDNGFHGAPRPMLPPPRQLQPTPQMPRTPAQFKDALAARANQRRKALGINQEFEFPKYKQQMGMAYAQPMPMPQRPQYQFGLPTAMGQMQGAAMGYQRRSPGANFDINGRPIGAWDYRPPQYGNPFLPMIPY